MKPEVHSFHVTARKQGYTLHLIIPGPLEGRGDETEEAPLKAQEVSGGKTVWQERYRTFLPPVSELMQTSHKAGIEGYCYRLKQINNSLPGVNKHH